MHKKYSKEERAFYHERKKQLLFYRMEYMTKDQCSLLTEEDIKKIDKNRLSQEERNKIIDNIKELAEKIHREKNK